MDNPIIELSWLQKLFLPSEVKLYIKAGLLNDDLQLTKTGVRAIQKVIFEAHRDALVKMAEERLAEMKEGTANPERY